VRLRLLTRNKISLALVLCIALLTQSCFFGFGGGDNADEVLLWSHRVVGYTDTARQVLLDLYCEACETHTISREQSLAGLRTLQKLHSAHAQMYELLRASLAISDVLTLTAESRAKVESLALSINDSVTALPELIGAAGARWAAITAPLRESVQELVNGLNKAKTAKRGAALRFNLTRSQVEQFNQQFTALQTAERELAVCLP